MKFAPSAIICTVLAVLLAPSPSPADDAGMALPIYPHSHYPGSAPQRPMNEKAASEAVIHGDQANLATADSPQAVDRWYRARLPKSCARKTITDTAMQYTCATRTVTILLSGGETSIVLGPKL